MGADYKAKQEQKGFLFSNILFLSFFNTCLKRPLARNPTTHDILILITFIQKAEPARVPFLSGESGVLSIVFVDFDKHPDIYPFFVGLAFSLFRTFLLCSCWASNGVFPIFDFFFFLYPKLLFLDEREGVVPTHLLDL